MRKRILKIGIFCCCYLVFISCKKPFTPKLEQKDINVLVVEGYIDGSDTISFKLSRTRKIYPGDTAISKNELNAHLTIQDNHNNSYPLFDKGNGLYRSNGILNLNPAYQYRIHLSTTDAKEYVSDFIAYKVSPPIDSVGWELKNDGVQVYVNTHDISNTTRFYRWEYSETWEFHSSFISFLQYDPINDTIVNRNDNIYTCWRTQNSSSIVIGSSAKLANDLISKGPILFFNNHDERLNVLYSILLKQYPLDENGYNYLLELKNNTENTGSIFDAQPTQTSGNIHNVSDASERVIGYVGAGNHVEKREFIALRPLPPGWILPSDCLLDTVGLKKGRLKDVFFTNLNTPVDYNFSPTGNLIGYWYSKRSCVDCTMFGTNVKPSFWP